MGKNLRQQLTLFVHEKDAVKIESIRKKFNPIQHQLIKCHVTLCREDEIQQIEKIIDGIQNIKASPITIQFGQVQRFDNYKGVLLPSSGENSPFHDLRKKILTILNMPLRHHEPHITLMHPRNSNCTDEDFKEIQSLKLPTSLTFYTVSLIEQIVGKPWKIIREFTLEKE